LTTSAGFAIANGRWRFTIAAGGRCAGEALRLMIFMDWLSFILVAVLLWSTIVGIVLWKMRKVRRFTEWANRCAGGTLERTPARWSPPGWVYGDGAFLGYSAKLMISQQGQLFAVIPLNGGPLRVFVHRSHEGTLLLQDGVGRLFRLSRRLSRWLEDELRRMNAMAASVQQRTSVV
jgi:hypothetical protein